VTQHSRATPFDNTTNGFTATEVQSAIEEAKTTATAKRTFLVEVQKAGSMSNASWFNRLSVVSGSYSGWPSGYPFVVPFDCTLTRVLIGLSGASYDYRNAGAGNVFIQLATYNHDYNGTTQSMLINTTITGSFSGGSFAGQNIKREITSWSLSSGGISLAKHDIIGVQFRKDTSQEGQCYTIVNPLVLLEYTIS
jgi:hypothetical protein